MMKHGPTGIPYANLNESRIRIRRHRHEPDWFSAWTYCLKNGDEDAAHIIRFHNDPDYEERCREEAAQIFPLESTPLRSTAELISEREEVEAA